jgi:hypothetical protein
MLIDFSLPTHAPVHKHILFSAMAMQITVQGHLSVQVKMLHHLFSEENSRMKKFRWIKPSSIQVYSKTRTPVITKYDSVWI